MIAASGIAALTGALVHHSAGDTADGRGRHESFITHKLAVSFAVLASAPFILAFRGVPTPGECGTFLWGIVPLVAAVLVARTGRLVLAEAALALGLVGFAGTLVLAVSVPVSGAVAWLVLAQWEAAASSDRRVTLVTSAALGSALVLGLAFAPPTSAHGAASLLSCGLASAYAVTLAATAWRSTRTPASAAVREPSAEMLASGFGDLLVRFDTHGGVERITGPCGTLLAAPSDELRGRGLFQIVHVADRPSFLKLIADAAVDPDLHTAIVRMRAPDAACAHGRWRFRAIEVRARRLDAETAGAPVVALMREAPAPTQAEPQASGAASRSTRDDFLANMSHELRTPLNAIIGFSEILGSHTLRPSEAAKQREYAQIIHQSGQHLLSVVNAILDMSKIRSGTFAILPEPFELAPLIEQCLDMVRLKAREGEVAILSDCPRDLEALNGDRRACKQIVLNLLSNAVKFTPAHGEVRISARPEGTSILLVVSDTGIGIGADDLARVGDPFFQARSSLSRPFEGTGLGLSVVRGLVGLHGGAMTIESEPTLGTRVTVRLPLDCRSLREQGGDAVIETIPRRSLARPAPARTASEPRMKSIA